MFSQYQGCFLLGLESLTKCSEGNIKSEDKVLMIYPSKSNVDLCKSNFSDIFKVQIKRSQEVKSFVFEKRKTGAVVQQKLATCECTHM